MAKLTASFKSFTFIYDFAVDGGVVGPIPSGVFLPVNFLVVQSSVQILTPLAGGAGATVEVGVTANTAFLYPTTLLAAFLTSNGIPVLAAPDIITAAGRSQLLLTVGINALTAGVFIFTVQGIEKTI